MLARGRVRFRRWARLWSAKLGALLPQRVERELFSPRVRYLDRHFIICAHDVRSRERAARLLARHLTSVQRRCLRERGFFVVRIKSGRQYRLWARHDFPVELIDNHSSRPRHEPWRYCIAAQPALLLADQMLELKLCLEADETHFLMISNPDFNEGIAEKALLRKNLTGAKLA
jgi:hypothetical protein